jgi:hypothetical protein
MVDCHDSGWATTQPVGRISLLLRMSPSNNAAHAVSSLGSQHERTFQNENSMDRNPSPNPTEHETRQLA